MEMAITGWIDEGRRLAGQFAMDGKKERREGKRKGEREKRREKKREKRDEGRKKRREEGGVERDE